MTPETTNRSLTVTARKPLLSRDREGAVGRAFELMRMSESVVAGGALCQTVSK